MKESEKKAYDYLKKYIKWETFGERNLEGDIKTILKLIEKQQKEIEKLKDEYKREVFEHQEFVEDTKVAVQDYISKDKIKEKIKELESHNWKDGYMSKFDKYAIHYLEELLSGQESDQEGGQEDE